MRKQFLSNYTSSYTLYEFCSMSSAQFDQNKRPCVYDPVFSESRVGARPVFYGNAFIKMCS